MYVEGARGDELESEQDRASSAWRSAHALPDHHLIKRDQLSLLYCMYTFQPDDFTDTLEAVQPAR